MLIIYASSITEVMEFTGDRDVFCLILETTKNQRISVWRYGVITNKIVTAFNKECKAIIGTMKGYKAKK